MSSSQSSSCSSSSPTRPSERPRRALLRRSQASKLTRRIHSKLGQHNSALTEQNILIFVIAFRLLNALCVRTFFQPDEFFQSLEPAWEVAFGPGRGAWITWEWTHHLRSSLHPLIFAAVYTVADLVARLLHLSPAIRADVLIAAPKSAQAVVAALSDFYTWKLARRVYGGPSHEAWAALALTVLSPWQWFCSTRTFSNCLETSLTIVALYFWPWQWSLTRHADDAGQDDGEERANDSTDIARLRLCLSLAALACILRPTNILIWMAVASFTVFGSDWQQRRVLVREVLICGSSVLCLSAVADRLFYGTWTFPPLKFLYFNIAQSLSVFYGTNDWHYYISQGYPLLLTTALPFTVVGLYRALAPTESLATDRWRTPFRAELAFICILMPAVLSLIAHKEVRFIYPLLPSLHVLTAPPLVDFFLPAISRSSRTYMPRRLVLLFLLLVNVAIALYTTLHHASGALSILSYLREQHQLHTPSSNAAVASSPLTTTESHPAGGGGGGITAGFLMPCHSTPWRSHLIYPTIDAWALTCEPPVNMKSSEKATYLDEADQFYADPETFLHRHMVGGLRYLPRQPSYNTPPARKQLQQQQQQHPHNHQYPKSPSFDLHEWPDYLLFFSPLEPTLRSLLRGTAYAECHREWNTAWHDDSRRRGDIVVFCLDAGEQRKWRTEVRRREVEMRDRKFEKVVEFWRREGKSRKKKNMLGQGFFGSVKESTNWLSSWWAGEKTQSPSGRWAFSSPFFSWEWFPQWMTPWRSSTRDRKSGGNPFDTLWS